MEAEPVGELGRRQLNTENWRNFALCKGMTEIFFSDDDHEKAFAMELCNSCKVQEICLQTAEANHERHGIWGGQDFYLSPRKRKAQQEQAARQ